MLCVTDCGDHVEEKYYDENDADESEDGDYTDNTEDYEDIRGS